MSNMKSIEELMWREEDQDSNRDKLWDPPAIKVSERNEHINEMYSKYVESCEEFGVSEHLQIDDYYIVHAHFIHFTMLAFVDGYIGHYGDRINSMRVFQMWLDKNYAGEKADHHFASVDRVHSYS